jgi:regulator of sigma E protease
MIESLAMQISSGAVLVLAFLLVLSAVVFVHELGHFLVARWCGVTVTTFSIGFGRELAGFDDRKGTHWRLAAIPLGGYVKFLDDENAASKPSRTSLEHLSPEARRGSFHDKPVWQRAAVVAAGPLANFLMAALIYSVINVVVGVRTIPPRIESLVPGMPAQEAGLRRGDLIMAIDGWTIETMDDVARIVGTSGARTLNFDIERDGVRLMIPITPRVKEHKDDLGVTIKLGDIGIRHVLPARVGEVVANLPAQQAGFRPGDLVTAIDGKPIATFDDIVDVVAASIGKSLRFTLDRGGERVELTVTPIAVKQKNDSEQLVTRGRIGIAPARPEPRSVTPAEAVRLGLRETYTNLSQTLAGLADIVARRQSADQVGGPILMAEVTARVVELGFEPLLRWTALISANIGLLNLLPIPVLDGGHLLFYAIEAVRRRPLSQRVQEIGFQIGLALVLMLVVFVNLNDLVRVGKRWLFGGG